MSKCLVPAAGRRRLLRIGLAGVAAAGVYRMPGALAQAAGGLEIHALDATVGRPAEGLAVELFLVSAEPAVKIHQAVTKVDGQATLIDGPVKTGRYELRFSVGDYFRRRGGQSGTPAFLEIVPIRLHLGEPNRRYHVPVVFTPWSYTMHG
jgi:5-hydroxyisourate hydrolase-like protein (transthyretin family)